MKQKFGEFEKENDEELVATVYFMTLFLSIITGVLLL